MRSTSPASPAPVYVMLGVRGSQLPMSWVRSDFAGLCLCSFALGANFRGEVARGAFDRAFIMHALLVDRGSADCLVGAKGAYEVDE